MKTLAVALLAATTAIAATAVTVPDFAAWDVDRDGSIAGVELQKDARMAESLHGYDRDDDGAPSPAEFEDFVASEIDTGAYDRLDVEDD